MAGNIGLYVHIPFCIRKCNYCDFLSFPCGRDNAEKEKEKEKYVDKLMEEIEMKGKRLGNPSVTSIFFGGGTPSCLKEGEILRIMAVIRRSFEILQGAEITIEANPGTVTPSKLLEYRQAGINRISFGVQSANDSELGTLGRIHSFAEAEEAFSMAREAGFTNINLDMMFAIPGMTVKSLANTLDAYLALGPEHISSYSLIVEEGTPFYEKYKDGEGLPAEDEEEKMYEMVRERLEEAGYHQYEISNYAKAGFESRHNMLYWQSREYLGVGLGSSSLIDGRRIKNECSLDKYFADCDTPSEEEELSNEDMIEEFMFMGLRMMKGVSREEFRKRFEREMDDVYGKVIEKYCKKGLLISEGDNVRLSEKGVRVSNIVFSEFLL